MYYSGLDRIRRLQKTLEKIAYVSVGTDFVIAGATYMVIRNTPYSNSLLMVSDYIDMFIVIVVSMLMFTLVLMKSQDAFVRKAKLLALRWPASKLGMRYLKAFLTSI
jgi:hypothetical protein